MSGFGFNHHRFLSLRKELKITQRELSILSGLSERSIQRIELGKGQPHRVSLLNFSAVMKKPISWFYEWDKEPTFKETMSAENYEGQVNEEVLKLHTEESKAEENGYSRQVSEIRAYLARLILRINSNYGDGWSEDLLNLTRAYSLLHGFQ